MTLPKPAVCSTPINLLATARWSPRAFDSRPVEPEKLLALFEAARWAPSCFGAEPWRFIVCDRARSPEAWRRAFDCLSEGNRAWAHAVPVLILVATDTRYAHNDAPNRFAQYDAGAAAMSLVLEAVAHGLVAHQMGGYDAERARVQFHIPDRFLQMAMIAVGYQASPETLPDALGEKERAPRHRRPLRDTFFEGDWNRGIEHRFINDTREET